MTARTYVVGLPVIATIDDAGFVTVEVDLSELGESIWDHESPEGEVDVEQVRKDEEDLGHWAQHHKVTGEGFIPTATYHGITRAECLNCGKVTTRITDLEILNDLDPTCTSCGVHRVRWTLQDGTTSETSEEDDR